MTAMKVYRVTMEYTTYVIKRVEAESPEEALVAPMNEDDFRQQLVHNIADGESKVEEVTEED